MVRCGKQRALYAFSRQTILIIISRFFLELHKIVAVEDDQTRSLPYFVSYRLPQRHNHTRDKQCFKGSLKTWRVCEVGGLLVMYGLYS